MTSSDVMPFISLTLLVTIAFIGQSLVIPLASSASFTLWGSLSGWGFTSSTITSPGPDLKVQAGESVSMTLTSADGFIHNFGVDYNGDGIRQFGEPQSPDFGAAGTTFTFAATTTPGVYEYVCFIHLGAMSGSFIVPSFTLFGRVLSPAGWGFTSTTVTSPGPDLAVKPGESVTMSLKSADGIAHNFGVDYNNDGIRQANEPLSANFGSAGTTFTFAATTTPGVYTYVCFIHLGAMEGPFIVSSHNVAVTGITASRYFAYAGVSSNPVQVDVTVVNKGSGMETFFASALANTVVIGNQSVTVPAGGTSTVTFTWHPENLPRGSYQLTGKASIVSGELSTGDNSFNGNTYTVRLKGDADGNCIVNIIDLATAGASFGKSSGQAGFNSNADMNNDLTVNIIDLATIGSVFGKTC